MWARIGVDIGGMVCVAEGYKLGGIAEGLGTIGTQRGQAPVCTSQHMATWSGKRRPCHSHNIGAGTGKGLLAVAGRHPAELAGPGTN